LIGRRGGRGSDAGLPVAFFVGVGSAVGLPLAFVATTGVDFGGAAGVGPALGSPALGNDVASATGMATTTGMGGAAGAGSLASPGRRAEAVPTVRGRSELLVVVALVGVGFGC